MRRIHQRLAQHESGDTFLFSIEYHFDEDNEDAIEIDCVNIHRINEDGMIESSIVEPDLEITQDVYDDACAMLHHDGAIYID